MPLAIFERRYLTMVRDCLEHQEPFGVSLIREGPEVGGIAQPYEVGTSAQIVHAAEHGQGLHILVVGQQRFRVNELFADGELLRAEVTVLPPDPAAARVSPELSSELAQMLTRHVETILALLGIPADGLEVPQEPERLSFMIAAHLTTSLVERQKLLEIESAAERLLRERELLRMEAEQYEFLLRARRRAETLQAQEEGGVFLSRN